MECTGLRTTLGTLAVTAAFLGVADLEAQTASVGAVFPLFATEEFCESSTFGALQLGFENEISGSIDGQIEAYWAPSGSYPWPWTPIGTELALGGGAQQAPAAYDHNGGLRVAVNALISLTQADRLGVKALVGAGVRRLGSADYAQGGSGEIERFGVDSQIAPLVTFGLVADIGLTDRMGLRLQGRGNVIFSGDLQLRGATSAQDRTVGSDTQTFGQAMVGLTFGLGDR